MSYDPERIKRLMAATNIVNRTPQGIRVSKNFAYILESNVRRHGLSPRALSDSIQSYCPDVNAQEFHLLAVGLITIIRAHDPELADVITEDWAANTREARS